MKSVRLLTAIGLLAAVGCADDSPKVYPTAGKVTLTGGDGAKLIGHHVEMVLAEDPAVRASGVIGTDGSFRLETLHNGKILKGVREGKYQARILPAEEDDNGKKLKRPPISPRHLKFETSGLSLQVPAAGDVTFELSPR